ncbi:MAG: hypothetical protein JXA18_05510 [Chitinispirillaceae bacterium]|nr:hypothetical protein [Chitinispirillaceae bacterium]
MAESFAKMLYPKLYSKLDKKKQETRGRPLTMHDINTLLSMQFNNKPFFPSIEVFYSEEYRQALINGVTGSELEKIERFRKPSESELNMLFSDIHVRDEKEQYTGSNQPEG